MPGPRRQRAGSSVVFTVVVTVLVTLGALVILAILAFSGAPRTLFLATVLAALPVGPLVGCYLWLDRYEPEPRTLLAAGLLWGCFVATALALLIQGLGGFVVTFTDRQGLELVAPVSEEACKGLFLFLLLFWRRGELDGVLDGIVYAGMVGIGFAFTENILYLAAAYNGTDGTGPGGTDALTATFVVRCVISPFAHPLFTTFTGIGVGLAVNARSRSARVLWPLAGYACAVAAHALWNTSTVYGFDNFAVLYVVLMAPAFLGVLGLAIWSRSSERRMLASALSDAAGRGLIPATDIGWVVDLRARRQARAYARSVGGRPGERAMRDYQQAAIELGFLHYRLLRGTPPPDYAARGQQFLQRIDALRPSIAFPRTGGSDQMSVSRDQNTRMLTALVRLRGALQAARLPLELPGVDELRSSRQQMIDQLEDYAIPRQMSVDAPLLVVVGGSTGAGKSTLVNSLVGARVTAPGMLRPTTRSPVLVHHPDEAQWFGQDRLLPDLVRVDHSTDDPHALQLVPSEHVPAGLAILDAPDVDSVEQHNREIAAQLLASADLWLFVTSAARYSDQVPWEHLRQAAERSTAVAVVLDRTAADAVPTVSAHLARMLASRGLKDSPLFTVQEADVSEGGLLAPELVADIRGWLVSLAADPDARQLVVRQTLDGSVRTLARRSHAVADAVTEQLAAAAALQEAAASSYDEATRQLVERAGDGTLLTGEVLARWQDLIGTGELLRGLDQRVGRLRDRLVNRVKGTPQAADRVALAIEAGAESLVLDQAEAAAEHTVAAWSALAGGAALLADHEPLGRATPEVRRRAEAEVRAWQQEVVELVRAAVAEWRMNADLLAYGPQGLAVSLMVQVLTRTAADAAAAHPGRTLLEAVLGKEAVDDLVERAGSSLDRRLDGLLDDDRRRFGAVLSELALDDDAAEHLRAASRRVDDRRFEQARGATDEADEADEAGPDA